MCREGRSPNGLLLAREVTPLKRAESPALVGALWLWSGAMLFGPGHGDGEQFHDFSLPGDKMT